MANRANKSWNASQIIQFTMKCLFFNLLKIINSYNSDELSNHALYNVQCAMEHRIKQINMILAVVKPIFTDNIF